MVFAFTFITMVGGNPKHDAYGFRYWKNPGAFSANVTSGHLGQFEGFLSALWSAVFTIVGPEYVSMLAGEAKLPRLYVKNAFKTTYYRFFVFFICSSLAVGIVVSHTDPKLISAHSGTATASPYVVAMQNMGIKVLPDVLSALLITSVFSAGNAYTFYATRSLYGLALEGQAPAILRKCTKSGVPIYCLMVVTALSCVAFLNVSSNTAEVLSWFINLVTTSGIINYIIISVTYIFFYRATQAQGVDRASLPYYGRFQPYCGYICIVYMTIVCFIQGYQVFLPGNFDVKTLITSYAMVVICPVLFFGWKLIHKTKLVRAHETDLVWEKPMIDEYEANFDEDVTGFWREILAMFKLPSRSKSTQINC